MPDTPAATSPRRRMTREQRFAQLLDVAWRLIADEGTDALSLGRLADAAGITKPTVYEHFGTRHGLLAALYQDFDTRQNQLIDAAIANSAPTLADKARVIATSYIGCVLTEGREIPDLLAALSGSAELARLRQQCQRGYLEKCRNALAPFAGARGIAFAALWAMLGAADALSGAALAGEITEDQADDELQAVVIAMVQRSAALG